MQTDRHDQICQIIDKSLAGATSQDQEQILRDHLRACAPCTEYLDASNRAIATLGGFSFDVDPGLDAKVLASLTQRAQELETKPVSRRHMAWVCLIAVLLTAAGSFTASRFGGLVSAVFHLQHAQWQFGLVAFWIVPSLCLCLLFVLLSVSHAGNEKGLSL
jgi:hypothetical protein